jgi:hypothetical protein
MESNGTEVSADQIKSNTVAEQAPVADTIEITEVQLAAPSSSINPFNLYEDYSHQTSKMNP